MHKSSSQTFFYKYTFPAIWAAIMILVIVFTMAKSDVEFGQWDPSILRSISFLGFLLLLFIYSSLKLRRVEVNKDYLKIRHFSGDEELVKYENIQWLYQIALINPCMVSLKYTDDRTGEFRTILILPSTRGQMFKVNVLAELDMTRFIREQVQKVRPEYKKADEPNKWVPALLVILVTFIQLLVSFTIL